MQFKKIRLAYGKVKEIIKWRHKDPYKVFHS